MAAIDEKYLREEMARLTSEKMAAEAALQEAAHRGAVVHGAILMVQVMLDRLEENLGRLEENEKAEVQMENDDSYRRRLLHVIGDVSINTARVRYAVGSELDLLGESYTLKREMVQK